MIWNVHIVDIYKLNNSINFSLWFYGYYFLEALSLQRIDLEIPSFYVSREFFGFGDGNVL